MEQIRHHFFGIVVFGIRQEKTRAIVLAQAVQKIGQFGRFLDIFWQICQNLMQRNKQMWFAK
jgi:hypothetical protein